MVIARRVRGRFSVTRLLSRLVRFYFVLSRSLLPPSRQPATLYLTLSYSLLIHPFCRFSRRRSRRAYFGPSMLLSLPIRPSHSVLSVLLSFPRVRFSRYCSSTLLSALTLFLPSLSATRSDALAPPADPSYSSLLSFSLSFLRAPSPSPIISDSPFSLPLFFFSFNSLYFSLRPVFLSIGRILSFFDYSHFTCSPSRVLSAIKSAEAAPRRFNQG